MGNSLINPTPSLKPSTCRPIPCSSAVCEAQGPEGTLLPAEEAQGCCGAQGWGGASTGMMSNGNSPGEAAGAAQGVLRGGNPQGEAAWVGQGMLHTDTPSVQVLQGAGCARLPTAPTPSSPQHSQLLCLGTPRNCPKLQLFHFQHFCCQAGSFHPLSFCPCSSCTDPVLQLLSNPRGCNWLRESLRRTLKLEFQGFLARQGGGRRADGENTSANALRVQELPVCLPCPPLLAAWAVE